MFKNLMGGSRWVWLFVVVLFGLIFLGVAMVPEVLRRGYGAPGTPAGLYILTLVTFTAFVGVIISLAVERFERLMVILFIGLRIAEITWRYQLGRYSLWYLAISVATHILVGVFVLLFLSGQLGRGRPSAPKK